MHPKLMSGLVLVVGVVASLVYFALPRNASASCEAGKLPVGYQQETGVIQRTLEVDGMERTYTLYIPTTYDLRHRTPLVFSLHGVLSNAGEQQRYTGWNEIAERENFIAVYPEGTPFLFGYRWNAGEPINDEMPAMNPALEDTPVDDVAFINALIDALSEQFCVDSNRIYVNGFSNGGGMTAHLACELSDRIAAVGTVAGAFTAIPGGCNPERPVSVIAFQGLADRVVTPDGNPAMGLISVGDWTAEWAARDECSPTPETIPGTSGAVTGIRYVDCAAGSEVAVYTIADGGHTWPGGDPEAFPFLLGKTSQDINASETMWQFFQAHPLQSS